MLAVGSRSGLAIRVGALRAGWVARVPVEQLADNADRVTEWLGLSWQGEGFGRWRTLMRVGWDHGGSALLGVGVGGWTRGMAWSARGRSFLVVRVSRTWRRSLLYWPKGHRWGRLPGRTLPAVGGN